MSAKLQHKLWSNPTQEWVQYRMVVVNGGGSGSSKSSKSSPSKSSPSKSSSYSSSRGSNFGGRFHDAKGGIASL